MLFSRDKLVVYYTAFVTLATFQGLQVLYNTLMSEFNASRSDLSLLLTVVFACLAVAPLFYGYLLESLTPKKVLAASLLLLSLFQLGIAASGSFDFLLLVRLMQGLLIPAILTSLMTYIGTSNQGAEVQSSMAAYIGSTILGGFLGRLLSGLISSSLGWRYAMIFFFAAQVLALALTLRIRESGKVSFTRPDLSKIPDILRQPGYLKIYLVVFCAFFVFASLLNFLPFRIAELGGASDLVVGVMYAGFSVGVVISLVVMRVIRLLGGEMRAALTGLCLFLASCLLMLIGSRAVIFIVMFGFCGGFFLVHTVLPGFINRMADKDKSLINALYLCFYYFGGTLGSYLPGFIYQRFGWNAYVLSLCLVILVGIAFALDVRGRAAHL